MGEILNSRQVMNLLGVCENTLLRMERDGEISIDFRISNRKRYYKKNIIESLNRLGN
jgi:predicted site-specific integrase-resolvase